MTPNTKHLEILSEQQKHIDILHECVKQFNLKHAIHEYNRADLKIATIPIRFDEALAAMQILQLRIDELEKENERLKKYTKHKGDCNTNRNIMQLWNLASVSNVSFSNMTVVEKNQYVNKLNKCTCGLDELLNPRNPEI